jgi:hypothetical protein
MEPRNVRQGLLLFVALLGLSTAAKAQTIVITTADDVSDACDDPRPPCNGNGNHIEGDFGDLPGPDGVVSLREALHAASVTPGTQNIDFGGIPNNAVIVLMQGPLDPYSDSGGKITGNMQTIKGEPWSSQNQGKILDGLTVSGDNNTIEGLVFNQFPNTITSGGNTWGSAGLVIQGNGNTVKNCVSGVDAAGSIAEPNTIGLFVSGNNNSIGPGNTLSGNVWYGLGITGDLNKVFGNLVGSTKWPKILGNQDSGIVVWGIKNIIGASSFIQRGGALIAFGGGNELVGNGAASTAQYQYPALEITGNENIALKNLIGVDSNATAAEPNLGNGVGLDSGAQFNHVIDNVISGNARAGVGVGGASNNWIERNRIGTDGTGASAIPNQNTGVYLGPGSVKTHMVDNIISANALSGVAIAGGSSNDLRGNLIGLAKNGSTPLPNGKNGVVLSGTQSNWVGIDPTQLGSFQSTFASSSTGNIISSNTRNGVEISGTGTDGNNVWSNRIGTDQQGAAARANGWSGILVAGGAKNNLVRDNQISGNSLQGVEIANPGTDLNRVEKNRIGTNPAGGAALANGRTGVWLHDGPSQNVIGGLQAGDGNVISGNAQVGVLVSQAQQNKIYGNIIGLDQAGRAGLSNKASGIYILDSSHDTEVGNSTPTSRNVISSNSVDGIHITDSDRVRIFNAWIGLDGRGASAFPNQEDGILVEGASNGTIVGGVAAGNVISGNTGHGIHLKGTGVVNTTISANKVGLDAPGTSEQPNQGDGIRIEQAQTAKVGGFGPAGNTLSGNQNAGISLQGQAQGITIMGNLIGLDAAGKTVFRNHGNGVEVLDGSNGIVIGTAINYIAGNAGEGIRVAGSATQNVKIEGNVIGLDRAFVAQGNLGNGILVEDGASGVFIGPQLGRFVNVIGSNEGFGILASGTDTHGVEIRSNFIGLTTRSDKRPNVKGGISIEDGAHQVNVGSGARGDGNHIAYNTGNGVQVLNDGTIQNRIQANEIFDNAALGIDLNGDGVDTVVFSQRGGGNKTMNQPSLCIGTDFTTGREYIKGQVWLPPGSAPATIDFYSNTAFDPTGFGQGQYYLGSVQSDPQGNVHVADISKAPLNALKGALISATATDADGNTSEFSPAVRLTIEADPRFYVRDKKGNADLNHWVFPRSLVPVINLNINPAPSTQMVQSRLDWQGVANAGLNTATVNGGRVAENKVGITFNGQLCHEARVWVTWSPITVTNVTPPNLTYGFRDFKFVQLSSGTTSQAEGFESLWRMSAQIEPASLITSPDHPDFSLSPQSVVPNVGQPHFYDGHPIFNPQRRWSLTRRVRAKIWSPNTPATQFVSGGSRTTYAGVPTGNSTIIIPTSVDPDPITSYPLDPVEGNDDSPSTVVNNDPYSSTPIGFLSDSLTSFMPVLYNQGPSSNDEVEMRIHYQEFLRLEIRGVWYRVSDYYDFRHQPGLIYEKRPLLGWVWWNHATRADNTNGGW